MTFQTTGLVKYSAKRDQIRDGDIILFRGKSLLSRLIRWVTRLPYSHAGVAGWWDDRLMVLEVIGVGVVASRLSHVLEKYAGRAELWVADEDSIRAGGKDLDRARVVAMARLELGKRYATWKLFAGLRRLVFGSKERLDPRLPPQKFVCSEYVSMVWKAGGVDLSPEIDKYTKPSDIARSPFLRRIGLLMPSPRQHDGKPLPEEQSLLVMTEEVRESRIS